VIVDKTFLDITYIISLVTTYFFEASYLHLLNFFEVFYLQLSYNCEPSQSDSMVGTRLFLNKSHYHIYRSITQIINKSHFSFYNANVGRIQNLIYIFPLISHIWS
jgi:hypothetical protein